MAHFQTIPDFQPDSFQQVCPITHLPKQKQPNNEPPKQPHEIDSFIFRGPEITFFDGRGERSLGYFDIRPAAIRDTAIEYLGLVDAGEHAREVASRKKLQFALDAARTEVESLKAQVSALTLGNAELLVQQESILRDRYGADDDYDDYLDMLDVPDVESLEALAEAEG